MGFFESSSWKGDNRPLSTLPKCGQCGLYKLCESPKMPPTGRGRRKVLFVGEAPGETEDKQGVQFVGDAGDCLRRIVKDCGLDLNDAYITNAAICRPPQNEISPIHIESCRPNLLNTLRALQPSVVVLLGGSPIKSLIETEWSGDMGAVGRWVGWQIPSPTYGVWLCPTYHPSFIIRSKEDPVLVRMAAQHIRAALELEGHAVPTLSQKQLAHAVEVLESPGEGIRRMERLATSEGVLAFDYETTGLKPERAEQRIFSVSFCLNGEETFACPVTPASYTALSRVLMNPGLLKVASNMKFEERWTRRKLGHPVAGWWWDTMLAAHVADNRPGITSIKFQGYVHFGVGEYSTWAAPFLESTDRTANGLNTIDKAPLKDVLLYNGIDSLMEYKVAMKQREMMQCPN